MNEKLINAILGYVARGENGSESISFIQRSLQQDGWKGLGNLAHFENLVKSLGFTVRDGKNSRGQSRREVTL
jgi:hypothetical protein